MGELDLTVEDLKRLITAIETHVCFEGDPDGDAFDLLKLRLQRRLYALTGERREETHG